MDALRVVVEASGKLFCMECTVMQLGYHDTSNIFRLQALLFATLFSGFESY